MTRTRAALTLAFVLAATGLHAQEFPSRDDPAKWGKIIRDHIIKDD